MNTEQFRAIAEKAIQESGEKMYKEMTNTPIKKIMFWIANKGGPM